MSSDKSYAQEYHGSSVTGSGQSYSNLKHYNQGYYKDVPNGAAAMMASNEVVVIPSFGGPSYSVSTAQQKKESSYMGYNRLSSAYPKWPYCGFQ